MSGIWGSIVREDGPLAVADDFYYGPVQFKINQGDYFTGTAASPTSAVYTLYHSRPGIGIPGTAITASGTTTEVYKADQGVVYMAIYGGTDFYPVTDQFIAANPRIISSYWEDFDNDGTDEFVVKLDVADVGQRGQGLTPVCALSYPLIDQDTSGLTSSSPADISSVGTSENVQTITWTLSGMTAQDGAVLARLYFVTNCTRGGDDVRLENVAITGGWTVVGWTDMAVPKREDNGDYEAWYYDTSDYTEVHNALLVYRGTNAADTLYITLSIRCTFESAEDHLIDLYAEFLDPAGAVVQVNDQVKLST